MSNPEPSSIEIEEALLKCNQIAYKTQLDYADSILKSLELNQIIKTAKNEGKKVEAEIKKISLKMSILRASADEKEIATIINENFSEDLGPLGVIILPSEDKNNLILLSHQIQDCTVYIDGVVTNIF